MNIVAKTPSFLRLSAFFLCLFVIQAISVIPAFAGSAEQKDHLWWAEALLKEITPGSTSYVHNRDYSGVSWKGPLDSTARSNTDCSGFMDELFVHTYGFTPGYMKKWLGGKSRPSASGYYGAIADQRGFFHIKKIRDAKPGDIIAVYYPFDRENTGHVMLIAAAPEHIRHAKPFVDGTEQWRVKVIDSSHRPHWMEDTRWKDGKEYGGLGKGSLRLYTNEKGEVTGYTWSLGSKSQYYDTKTRPIAIGRLNMEFHRAGNIK